MTSQNQELVRMIHSYKQYWDSCRDVVNDAMRNLQSSHPYIDASKAMEQLEVMRLQLRDIATKALQLSDFPKATKALEILRNICKMMDSLHRGDGGCAN